MINTARRINAYFFALFGLIVPFIVIVILYGLIINVLRKNAQEKQVAKGKKRVTKMVSAVISSFVICWTPMQIYLLYTHHNQVTFLFAILAQSLVYISSCVNPILYAFLSEPFRQAFQQFLTCSKILSNHLINTNENDNGTSAKKTSYRPIKQQEKKVSLTSKSPSDYRTTNDIDLSATPLTESSKSNRLSNSNRMKNIWREIWDSVFLDGALGLVSSDLYFNHLSPIDFSLLISIFSFVINKNKQIIVQCNLSVLKLDDRSATSWIFIKNDIHWHCFKSGDIILIEKKSCKKKKHGYDTIESWKFSLVFIIVIRKRESALQNVVCSILSLNFRCQNLNDRVCFFWAIKYFHWIFFSNVSRHWSEFNKRLSSCTKIPLRKLNVFYAANVRGWWINVIFEVKKQKIVVYGLMCCY